MVAIWCPEMRHAPGHHRLEAADRRAGRSVAGHGFSLVELMLSLVFILLSIAWITRITTNAQVAVRNGNLVDSIYTSINEDTDKLRKVAMNYACASTDGSTGDCLSYKTAFDPSFVSACTGNSVALKMWTDPDLAATFVPNPTTLVWTPNAPAGVAIPSSIAALTITRTISQDTDKSRIFVSYATAAPSPLNIAVTTIIVPQAQAWCPGPK